MKIKYRYHAETNCIYCNAPIESIFRYECGTPVATVIKNPHERGYLPDGVLPTPSEKCEKRSFKEDVEEALDSIERENPNSCAQEPYPKYIEKPWWKKLFNL